MVVRNCLMSGCHLDIEYHKSQVINPVMEGVKKRSYLTFLVGKNCDLQKIVRSHLFMALFFGDSGKIAICSRLFFFLRP